MSICASGASHIKSTTPAALMLTSEYMASALPPTLSWIVPFLPYIQPILIENVTNFCSIDPPGNPSLVGVTIGAVLAGGELGAAVVATDAITQILLNYFWYKACECTTGATPAAPTAPTAPTDLPAINPPGLVNLPANGTCATFTGVVSNVDSSHSYIPIQASFPGVIPKTFRVTVTKAVTIGAGASSNHHIIQYSTNLGGSGAVLKDEFISIGPSGSQTVTLLAAAGVQFIQVQANYTSGTGSSSVTSLLELFCAEGVPGQPAQPCCPPDPGIMRLLNQILDTSTLIQRQAVPFAYVAGTVHSGLADLGSLSIQGLLGVVVDVTTIPDHFGREAGDPIEYFDLGFVTFGTADGYLSSTRIEHEHQTIFPPVASVYTTLGYTLRPGVVVDLTELVREP